MTEQKEDSLMHKKEVVQSFRVAELTVHSVRDGRPALASDLQ